MSRMKIDRPQKGVSHKVKQFGKERTFYFIKPVTIDYLRIQHKIIQLVIGSLKDLIPDGLELKGLTLQALVNEVENLPMQDVFESFSKLVERIDFGVLSDVAVVLLDQAVVDGKEVGSIEDSPYFDENPEDIYLCVIAAVQALYPNAFSKGLEALKRLSAQSNKENKTDSTTKNPNTA